MAQARLSSPQLAATLDACLENPEFTASPTASSLAVWTEALLQSRRAWQSGGRDIGALPAKIETATLAQLQSATQAGQEGILEAETQVSVEEGLRAGLLRRWRLCQLWGRSAAPVPPSRATLRAPTISSGGPRNHPCAQSTP